MSTVDNAIQALFQMAHKELLWKNASPTSTFAEQNISVNLSEYDMIAIEHATPTNGTIFAFITDISPVERLGLTNNSGELVYGAFCQSGAAASTRGYSVARRYDIDDNALHFRTGSRTLELTTTVDNKMCIPYRIWGLKV